jgi:hypothetical protein
MQNHPQGGKSQELPFWLLFCREPTTKSRELPFCGRLSATQGCRKHTLFYKTENGAHVGDLFMSLIHTCQLCGANPFEYRTKLQQHGEELSRSPKQWMPWNYRDACTVPA